MPDDNTPTDKASRGRNVPTGRMARAGRFGGLAAGIAGGALSEGARRLARGERPKMRDMLLTPGNARRVADQLANLRGAAMKIGQMLSMDAGDFLPPELSDILARLRDNAVHMPPKQLDTVLRAEWGEGWRRRFKLFQGHPLAAASIGQVHKAILPDGTELAVKVQYPGVKESIDADVDNAAMLLRRSGLLPAELDVSDLLVIAKEQLHDEADYEREARYMAAFADHVADDDRYLVPRPYAPLTTGRVLAMDYLPGRSLESLKDQDQETRNRVMQSLIELVLREMFEFGMMQTDPNFANYRYQLDTGKLVLLDFGAARDVPADLAEGYRQFLMAGLDGDRDAVRRAVVELGFVSDYAAQKHADALDRMSEHVLNELGDKQIFDFSDRAFLNLVRAEGQTIAEDRATWHIPPADILFVQRKISGTALLAAQLGAKLDVRAMVERYRDWRPEQRAA